MAHLNGQIHALLVSERSSRKMDILYERTYYVQPDGGTYIIAIRAYDSLCPYPVEPKRNLAFKVFALYKTYFLVSVVKTQSIRPRLFSPAIEPTFNKNY